MDPYCAICCDDIIVKNTGCTTLSCEHTFHYSCITSWFLKTEAESSCPSCRKLMGPMEDVPHEEDEDEEYEEEDDEEDDPPSFFTYSELNRLIRSRGGHGITMAQWMHMQRQEGQTMFNDILQLNSLLIGNGAYPLSEIEWTSIPCDNFVESPLPYEHVSTVHMLEGGDWSDQIMNPEELTGVSVYLEKVHVGGASIIANLLAKKIQKKWRSTRAAPEAAPEAAPITLQELEATLIAA